jgi:hypothetical protein
MKALIKIVVTLSLIYLFVSCHEESLIEPQKYSKSNTEVKLNKKKQISVPAGIIGWWSGNMNSEDQINNYDGLLLNGASYKKGMVKKAFKFNWEGWESFSAPYMLIENAELTNDLQSFTMEMWIKLEGTELSERTRIERFMTIAPYNIEKASIRHDGGSSKYPSPGNLHFFMRLNGEFVGINVENVLTTNTFHHIAGTYDGESMKLYLDGEMIKSKEFYGVVAEGNNQVILSSPEEPLDGIIDEACIYNRALTEEEIFAIYNSSKWGKYIN